MSGTVPRNRAFSLSAMLIAAVGLVAASAVCADTEPANRVFRPGNAMRLKM